MDFDEIRKWHSLIKRDDELFEIRIIGDRTYSGYFNDIEKAITALKPFDSSNIYYTVNEVKKACASRTQFNKFQQVKGTATSEQDIEHRWYIPIDVDCIRPSGVSSTDEEKQKAHIRAVEVYKFLKDNNFTEPIICDSSSGYHILVPIDMDNTPESKELVKSFLDILSNRFDDDTVKIDTVLHDANRILRLSGSYGRKGNSTEERPHRMAMILKSPDKVSRMPYNAIKLFCDKFILVKEINARQGNYGGSNAEFDLRKFISEHGINVHKEISQAGGGTKFILSECLFCSDHKAPDAALFQLSNGAIAYKCFHNSCQNHTWQDVRKLYDPAAYDRKPDNYQQQYPQKRYQPRTREIKKEDEAIGKKWMCLSNIKKIDFSAMESVLTGFVGLDSEIKGLRLGEISILSGSNSSGKSSWLNSLSLNAIQQGYKVALWSGELQPSILKAWITHTAAGLHYLKDSKKNIGTFYLEDSISDRISQWSENKLFIYNNEYGSKWEQVFNDMKEVLESGVKLCILDNLFSLDIDIFEGDKNNKQKELVLQLCDFTKKNNIHLILVCHPRKQTTFLRKDDISGSSDLGNAVDNILICHRVNNDFRNRASEYFGATVASSYYQYGNVIEVAKNRMYGKVDYMCGMYYEIGSRRFKNTIDEDIHYGWEQIPIQTSLNMESNQNEDDLPFDSPTNEAPF